MTDSQINVDSPMKQAFDRGVTEYEPIFRGTALDVEASDADNSFNNLRRILDCGVKVAGMHVGPSGVLITFCTGESYLATGFAVGNCDVGHEGLDLLRFAQFANAAGLGRLKDWKWYLATLPSHFRGQIELAPPTGLQIQAFNNDAE